MREVDLLRKLISMKVPSRDATIYRMAPNFRNFRNCMVSMKIIFTKIFVLSIGYFRY